MGVSLGTCMVLIIFNPPPNRMLIRWNLRFIEIFKEIRLGM